MIHPENSRHTHAEKQYWQDQITFVFKEISQIQTNGNEGNVAGNIENISSGIGAERDRAKGDSASEIDEIAEGGMRYCIF
jgi:hypothetical protein